MYISPISLFPEPKHVKEMDHDHDHGHMHMSPPPANSTGMPPMHHMEMMMHMTFYWGKKAEILFSGWPGTRSGMYALALIVVFVMAIIVEWLSHCQLIKPGSTHVAAGVVQTLLHAIRMGLEYMVMLALMSFNGGMFLVAVAGHAVGFLVFGSRLFRGSETLRPSEKAFYLSPMSC
ncbi:hypothetical protein AAG906_032751 [Vitis piasezkii]